MKTIQVRAHLTPGPHIVECDGHSEAFGVHVRDAKIDPSIELSESVIDTLHISDELGSVTWCYSIHVEFYGDSPATRREPGGYAHKDAVALVEHGKNSKHDVTANGETLANAMDLCERIWAGDIHPLVPHRSGQEALHHFIGAVALALNQRFQRLAK